jgi:RNA polymerase sigma-70 factor (ECF subfamily)
MQDERDEDIMLRYQKGDAQAMDELLRRYKNPVYCFVYRITNNAAEAEDIAQEVFLKLHQFRQRYAPEGKFSTWLFTIAHNLCISNIRKKKWLVFWPRRKDNPDELVDYESPDPSPCDVAGKDEISDMVRRCIQSLPFLQKEALILREYEQLGYQEIAKILHKPQGTIKTLIHRARALVKEKLLPYIEEVKGVSHA